MRINKKVLIPLGMSILYSASAMATYTPNYTEADMPNIVVDGLAHAGVKIIGLLGLIILVLLIVYTLRAFKKR